MHGGHAVSQGFHLAHQPALDRQPTARHLFRLGRTSARYISFEHPHNSHDFGLRHYFLASTFLALAAAAGANLAARLMMLRRAAGDLAWPRSLMADMADL